MNVMSDIDSLPTMRAELYESSPENTIRCLACAHHCVIADGRAGICKVRSNVGGSLQVPGGYVAAINADPIEKKPFYHVLPGSKALTFGMLGCNLKCDFCQNWEISQVGRVSTGAEGAVHQISPDEIVSHAKLSGARSVVSSYNEPLITSEWARAVFTVARAEGFMTGVVSNGFASLEALEYLAPQLDFVKIDLKTMSERSYKQLGGRLEPVMEAIKWVWGRGLWVEVVTLVTPGFNDTLEELRSMAGYLASVSPNIPWHVTAFHPDYHRVETHATPTATLVRAASIGREAGLHYVYVGNVFEARNDRDTVCAACGASLVERGVLRVHQHVTAQGDCPSCGSVVPGIWN